MEGHQNMAPQNMPPWHKDYFVLVIFEKLQTQELCKQSIRYPFVGGIYMGGAMPGRELCPHITLFTCVAGQTLFTIHFLF